MLIRGHTAALDAIKGCVPHVNDVAVPRHVGSENGPDGIRLRVRYQLALSDHSKPAVAHRRARKHSFVVKVKKPLVVGDAMS